MDKKEQIDLLERPHFAFDTRKGSRGTDFDELNDVEQCSFENKSLIVQSKPKQHAQYCSD